MPKKPKFLRHSNPEAIAVEVIENQDAAREAAAANAALPRRDPVPVAPRPPNEVDSGKWSLPPRLNTARTAFVRDGNRSDSIDPVFLLIGDVATKSDLEALRAAEAEIDRLVTLKAEYSHGAIDRRHKEEIATLHLADTIDAKALSKLQRSRDEEKEVSNAQRHVIDSHIAQVQASIEVLIRYLFKRGSDVLQQEAAEYESELTNRAARYGLKPSPSDALLALRILRERCETCSLPGPGTLPAGEWRPSSVLRKVFHDAHQVLAVPAEHEVAE